MARYRLIRVSPQHVTITDSSAHASTLGSACYSRSLPFLLAGFNTQDSRRWSRCSRFTVLFIGVKMEQYRTTYVHYTLYAISRHRRSSRTVHQGLPSSPKWHSFNRRDLSRLHHRIECQYHLWPLHSTINRYKLLWQSRKFKFHSARFSLCSCLQYIFGFVLCTCGRCLFEWPTTVARYPRRLGRQRDLGDVQHNLFERSRDW